MDTTAKKGEFLASIFTVLLKLCNFSDHLEAPTEFFHVNKDILNNNFDGQGNTFKSQPKYDIKPKLNERPRNNQIESKPRDYSKNINTLDDSDIRFLNEVSLSYKYLVF